MARLAGGLTNRGDLISSEKIDEIGLTLIECYGSVDLAAQELDMAIPKLKWLIREVPELQVYFEVAHEGIKSLTDKRIIEGLRKGDQKIIKLVFNKMYAGRARGGYNIAELGTFGYHDPLAKKLAAETEQDTKKGNVQVSFNFIQKDIRDNFDPITVEGNIIDADEVEDEN